MTSNRSNPLSARLNRRTMLGTGAALAGAVANAARHRNRRQDAASPGPGAVSPSG